MTEGKTQMSLFDKPIAELRVNQLFDQKTGIDFSWAFEFRFLDDDKWYPIPVVRYGVDLEQKVEENNEPTTAD